MKKIISPRTFFLLLILPLLNSCVKDTCSSTYTYSYYTLVYETVEQLKLNIKSDAPQEIQNPGKMVLLGHYIFLNEIEKGIHVIDNSNPAAPRNISFVNIPGNMDIAAKGNTLYADSYSDLVTLDISDPQHLVLKNYTENVLQFLYSGTAINYNSQTKIASWIKKDTTITESCPGGTALVYFNGGAVFYSSTGQSASVPAANTSSGVGMGGSMARFAIVNNYMYTVNESDLHIFNIANSNDPQYVNQMHVDFHVETIYPFENKLFIGSNNGMFIYSLGSSPESPVKSGEFTHVRSCDPVISDGGYAYITLHSESTCQGFNNELDIVRLNMLVDASLVQTYSLTSPRGLAKDGDLLFVCDGNDGVKVFDASDVMNLKLIKQIPNSGTYDVILHDKVALVVAEGGLYQYDYSDLKDIHLISKISLSKS